DRAIQAVSGAAYRPVKPGDDSGGCRQFCPISNGVMRRTATRRFARSGPSFGIFRDCLPYPFVVRVLAGTLNWLVNITANHLARRSDRDRLSTSLPTASV